MKHWRTNLLFFLFIIIGAALTSRLFYLQVSQYGFYAALAQGQHKFSKDIEPKRGEIFMKDKDGNLQPLASNIDWKMIYANPAEIKDPQKTTKTLSAILKIPETELIQKIGDSQSSYKIIARRIDSDIASKILEFGFDGIYDSDDSGRYYPGDELASHLIGFMGYKEDKKAGQYGLEGYYNDLLSGLSGKTFGEKDAFGNLIAVITSRTLLPVKNGKNLILTIDPNIQYQTEKILKEFFEQLKAASATIIVTDPNSGQIKSLANLPNFNPNKYQEENLESFVNSAIQKIFEPGSIIKPITIAAAVDAGKISPDTTYLDAGEVKIGGYLIQNFDKKAHGKKTMTEVLEMSLNTGAVFAQKKLGNDLFLQYMKNFGFSSKTGIDLEGEVAGNIKNLYAPYEINFATASFGQGIALTPMEIVSAFSAIANQGKIMKPYLVEKIIGGDGSETEIGPQIVSEVISPRTASQVSAMMVSVVDNGFSKKAAISGYFVAAKTGTAEVPSLEKKGYTDKTIHSFVGFAPAFKPKFLIFMKFDNPQGIRFAADSIAPAFARLAKYILDYYEIPPER